MKLRVIAALAAVLAGHAAPVAPAAAAGPEPAGPAAARALLGGYLAAPDSSFLRGEPFDGRPLLAGDLDRDGGTDFGLGWAPEAYQADSYWPGAVTVHQGGTGEVMWSAPLPGYLSFPVFTTVGPRGGRGLVVVSYDDGEPHRRVAQPVTVRAYDAAGRGVWTFGGAAAARVVVTDGDPAGGDRALGTVVYGVGNLVRGGGADLLVGTVGWRGPRNRDAEPWLMRFEVVDGADGTVRPLGDVMTGVAASVSGAVLPDVDGDGLDDVALVTGGRPDTERPSTVRALSSRDGAPRWTLTALPADDDMQVMPVPDLTGDGERDLAVRVDFDAVERNPCCATTTFVDGVSGRALWTRPGYRVEPLGRHLLVHANGGRNETVTAYTRSGRALWSVRSSSRATGAERARIVGSDGPVGDVDGDGDVDAGYFMDVLGANARVIRREYAVLDGTTGRVLHRYPSRVRGSGAAVDGSGPDVVSADVTNGILRVTAWNGRTARPLWSSSYRVPDSARHRDLGSSAVTVFRGDRDRCADVVVTLDDRDTRVATVGFSGATGRAVWAADRTDEWPVPSYGRRPARRYC